MNIDKAVLYFIKGIISLINLEIPSRRVEALLVSETLVSAV